MSTRRHTARNFRNINNRFNSANIPPISLLSVPTIGSAFGGGFFAGQISTAGNGIADYNLVVGPLSSAETTGQWKTLNTTTSGTTSLINGAANSAAMNNASHPAAQFCEGVNVGGFTDWYMPARYELEICYYNLKPTTTNNNTGGTYGQNPYSVPTRSVNWTSGNPAQTSATSFQTGNAEAYSATGYWDSSEANSVGAYGESFSTGLNTAYYKTDSRKVRAIRKVAV